MLLAVGMGDEWLSWLSFLMLLIIDAGLCPDGSLERRGMLLLAAAAVE